MSRSFGFTLVELLIVIIVIAVLAAIAIPKFASAGVTSKESALREDLRLIREATDRAEVDTGLIVEPDALTSSSPPAIGYIKGDLGRRWSTTSIPAGTWRGPYLTKLPINPMTGDNSYNSCSAGVAWTFCSETVYSDNTIYTPLGNAGSNGVPYNEW